MGGGWTHPDGGYAILRQARVATALEREVKGGAEACAGELEGRSLLRTAYRKLSAISYQLSEVPD
jgi:hypothetical protein